MTMRSFAPSKMFMGKSRGMSGTHRLCSASQWRCPGPAKHCANQSRRRSFISFSSSGNGSTSRPIVMNAVSASSVTFQSLWLMTRLTSGPIRISSNSSADGSPIVVAGVPPDYFSATTGQLWGNPLYNWERMGADGFSGGSSACAATLKTVGHRAHRSLSRFCGLLGNSRRVTRPLSGAVGLMLQAGNCSPAIREALGRLPIIAEDLGVITPEVEQLRDDFAFPGMRILQFAFSSDPQCQDLPHNYQANVVAYTGTHDNDTTVGWFQSVAGEGSTRDGSRSSANGTLRLSI